jgi:threonine/homoserine/homoserine lactone efflux protein
MGTMFLGLGAIICFVFICMMIAEAVVSDYLTPKILVIIVGIAFILIGLKLGVNI